MHNIKNQNQKNHSQNSDCDFMLLTLLDGMISIKATGRRRIRHVQLEFHKAFVATMRCFKAGVASWFHKTSGKRRIFSESSGKLKNGLTFFGIYTHRSQATSRATRCYKTGMVRLCLFGVLVDAMHPKTHRTNFINIVFLQHIKNLLYIQVASYIIPRLHKKSKFLNNKTL